MNFKPLRPRLKIGPYLQGKKGQNKPENPQNWNMAKIAPKSDKFMKYKVVSEFWFVTRSAISLSEKSHFWQKVLIFETKTT